MLDRHIDAVQKHATSAPADVVPFVKGRFSREELFEMVQDGIARQHHQEPPNLSLTDAVSRHGHLESIVSQFETGARLDGAWHRLQAGPLAQLDALDDTIVEYRHVNALAARHAANTTIPRDLRKQADLLLKRSGKALETAERRRGKYVGRLSANEREIRALDEANPRRFPAVAAAMIAPAERTIDVLKSTSDMLDQRLISITDRARQLLGRSGDARNCQGDENVRGVKRVVQSLRSTFGTKTQVVETELPRVDPLSPTITRSEAAKIVRDYTYTKVALQKLSAGIASARFPASQVKAAHVQAQPAAAPDPALQTRSAEIPQANTHLAPIPEEPTIESASLLSTASSLHADRVPSPVSSRRANSASERERSTSASDGEPRSALPTDSATKSEIESEAASQPLSDYIAGFAARNRAVEHEGEHRPQVGNTKLEVARDFEKRAERLLGRVKEFHAGSRYLDSTTFEKMQYGLSLLHRDALADLELSYGPGERTAQFRKATGSTAELAVEAKRLLDETYLRHDSQPAAVSANAPTIASRFKSIFRRGTDAAS